MATDFHKEPWKHPAAWKAHLVTRCAAFDAGVPSEVAFCECRWSACVRTDRGPQGELALDRAVFDHWREVVREAEAVAA